MVPLPPFIKHLNGALCQRVSGGGVLCGGNDFPSVSRPFRGIAAEAPTTATHAPGAHPRSCAIDDLGNTSGEPAAELWVGRSRQWGARTGTRGLSQGEHRCVLRVTFKTPINKIKIKIFMLAQRTVSAVIVQRSEQCSAANAAHSLTQSTYLRTDAAHLLT